MTTDRELLEMAAKAAGMTEHRWCDAWACLARWTNDKDGWYFEGPSWNPLTKDDDALRLAVKLRINLHVCESDAMTTAYADGGIQGAAVDFMDDAYAATRRAIVCAAAEIGKAMP
jgi:hypothetical protein